DRRLPLLGVLGQRRERDLGLLNLRQDTLAQREQRGPLPNLLLQRLSKHNEVALARQHSELPAARLGLAVFYDRALLEHGIRADEHEQEHDAAEPRRDGVEERHREYVELALTPLHSALSTSTTCSSAPGEPMRMTSARFSVRSPAGFFLLSYV